MAITEQAIDQRSEPTLDSYRRLAGVFHDVLSEHDADAVLDRVADTLAELIPYDSLTVYRANEADRTLVPVLARDQWAEEVLAGRIYFGDGLTGWAAEHRQPILANEAHLDSRADQIPALPRNPRQ